MKSPESKRLRSRAILRHPFLPGPGRGVHPVSSRSIPAIGEPLFNESFFKDSRNWLPDLLPDFAYLAGTVRVIDVANTAPGMVLQILMNGELDEALAVLPEPSPEPSGNAADRSGYPPCRNPAANTHWRWRLQSVERMAELMDPARFGVKAMYLFGSTKNATAGPQSDIDLLIHFNGTQAQEKGTADLARGLEPVPEPI